MKKTVMLLMLLCTSCFSMGLSVNKSIVVEKGERTGGCTSVNGSITVKDDAKVYGMCRTVNGQIRIQGNCRVEHVQSVNGSIHIGEATDVEGDISTVNGSVTCKKKVKVDGDIKTVNGYIELVNTTVTDDISTHNGDITLNKNSTVLKDIIIKDSHNSHGNPNHLKIRIVDSTVEGDIVNRDRQKSVTVYLVGDSRVNGEFLNIDRVER
ncbi:MAG: hypothetical protein U5R06_10305 [candidate division KSB1 bacterium]|nr:hypothetical protein [candidate division KSB1 bacterium]